MTDTITVVDNRTGREYTLPIVDGTIRASDLAQIRAEGDDHDSDRDCAARARLRAVLPVARCR